MTLLYARATINLPGLSQGHEAFVDPDIPYIGNALAARFLIPVDVPPGVTPAQEEVPDGA